MLRSELDRRLGLLSTSVLEMGQLAETAISDALDALVHHDLAVADRVICGDDVLDSRCNEIEEMGSRLITLQQPALRDLRAVLAAMAIAEDLERIGDHAEGIAQLVRRLPGTPSTQILQAFNGIAALARVQLQGALDAYRAGDASRAREVWAGDHAVNTLYERLVHNLISAMTNDQEAVTLDTYLLWIAHNIERIADRAATICERVVFIATGERSLQTVAS